MTKTEELAIQGTIRASSAFPEVAFEAISLGISPADLRGGHDTITSLLTEAFSFASEERSEELLEELAEAYQQGSQPGQSPAVAGIAAELRRHPYPGHPELYRLVLDGALAEQVQQIWQTLEVNYLGCTLMSRIRREVTGRKSMPPVSSAPVGSPESFPRRFADFFADLVQAHRPGASIMEKLHWDGLLLVGPKDSRRAGFQSNSYPREVLHEVVTGPVVALTRALRRRTLDQMYRETGLEVEALKELISSNQTHPDLQQWVEDAHRGPSPYTVSPVVELVEQVARGAIFLTLWVAANKGRIMEAPLNRRLLRALEKMPGVKLAEPPAPDAKRDARGEIEKTVTDLKWEDISCALGSLGGGGRLEEILSQESFEQLSGAQVILLAKLCCGRIYKYRGRGEPLDEKHRAAWRLAKEHQGRRL